MSNTVINVRFNVQSDMGALNAQIKTVNAELAKHAAVLKTVAAQQTAVNLAGSNFTNKMRDSGLFTTSMVKMGDHVDDFGKRLVRNKLSLGEYRKALRDYRKDTELTQSSIGRLAQYQARMKNSVIYNKGDGSSIVATPKGVDMSNAKEFEKVRREGMAAYNTALRQANESLINWGKNTQWAGRQLTVGLTVPMTIFGAMSARVFLDADKRLTDLAKVYGSGINGASAAAISEIKGKVLSLSEELSATTGTGLNDLLDLAASIASTGKEGDDLLTSIRETNRLMVLGDIGQGDAMKTTLSLQTAFKVSTSDLAKEINFMNAAENATSLTMADMTEAIPRAGTVVKALGGDVQDLALYMTAMKEGGVSAAEGANALKAGLASIINPSSKAKKVLGSYGIDIESIVKANKGQLTPTILALQKELSGLDGLARSKSIAALFGKYQFARMSALFNNLGAEGSQTLQIMNLMGGSAEQLAAIADKELRQKTGSLSNRFKSSVNEIKNSLIPIGRDFVKMILPVLNLVTKILRAFNDIPSPIKKMIELLLIVGAVLGPVVMIMGTMANFMGQVKKGMNSIGSGLSKAIGKPRQLMEQVETPETVAYRESISGNTKAVVNHTEAITQAALIIKQVTQGFLGSNNVNSSRVNGTYIPGSSASSGHPSGLFAAGIEARSLTTGKGGDKPRAISGMPGERINLGQNQVGLNMLIQTVVADMAGTLKGALPAALTQHSDPSLTKGTVGKVTPAGPGAQALAPKYLAEQFAPTVKSLSSTIKSLESQMMSQSTKEQAQTAALIDVLRQHIGMIKNNQIDATGISSHVANAGDFPSHGVGRNPVGTIMENSDVNSYGRGGSVMTVDQIGQANTARLQAVLSQIQAKGDKFGRELVSNNEKVRAAFVMQIAAMRAADQNITLEQSLLDVQDSETLFMSHLDAIFRQAQEDITDSTGSLKIPMPRVAGVSAQRNRSVDRLVSRSTPGLQSAIGGAEVASVALGSVATEAGKTKFIFELLDAEGNRLALAMRTASGRLGLLGAQGGPLTAKYDAPSTQKSIFDANIAPDLSPAVNEAGDLTRALDEAANSSENVSAASDRSATGGKRFAAATMGAVGSMGLLMQMSMIFTGNMDSIVSKMIMYGGTVMMMIPMIDMMLGGVLTKMLAAAGGLVASLLSSLGAAVPALRVIGIEMQAALFGPWGLAIALVTAALVGLWAWNKKKTEAAIKKQKEYNDALKYVTSVNPVNANRDVLGLNENTKAAKDYAKSIINVNDMWRASAIASTGSAAASKSDVESVTSANADLIASLKKLSDVDFTSALKRQYLNLLASGVSNEGAQRFINSLAQAAGRAKLTVNVIGVINKWQQGKGKDSLYRRALQASTESAPDVKRPDIETSMVPGAAVPGSNGQGTTPGVPVQIDVTKVTGDLTKQNAPKYEAYGRAMGAAISAGIQSGEITIDNLTAELSKTRDAAVAAVESGVRGDDNFARLIGLNDKDVNSMLSDMVVPLDQGFKGLADRFLELDQAGRTKMIDTLRKSGGAGANLAEGLLSVDTSTSGVIASIKEANPQLAQMIDLIASGKDGWTAYESAARTAGSAMTEAEKNASTLSAKIVRGNKEFASQFSAGVQSYINTHVEKVAAANTKMVDDYKQAESDKMDAFKTGLDDKEAAAQKAIDKIKTDADAEIKTIKDVEEKRKAAFEAQQERIRRLEKSRNYNIDYAQAVGSGDLYAAGRVRNEQDAYGKSNAISDKEKGSETAADKKVAAIETERDKKITAANTALDAMKKADKASVKSAQDASDKRIKAVEATATASNKAAKAWKKDQNDVVSAMNSEFAAAEGNISETLAVAKRYAPKFGISATAAVSKWESIWKGLGAGTAKTIKDEGKDPELLKQATMFSANLISKMLKIKIGKYGNRQLQSGAVSISDYFGARQAGDTDLEASGYRPPRVAGPNSQGGITRAEGGYVSGPGGPTSDSIPARLSNGEFVQKAAAVKHYGIDFMKSVNNKTLHLAGGGFVEAIGHGATRAALPGILSATAARVAYGIKHKKKPASGSGTGSGSAQTGPSGSFSPGNYGPVNTHGPAGNTAAAANFTRKHWGVGVGTWRPPGGIPGDHPLGKAMDAMTTNQKIGDAISGWFLSHPEKYGTKYVIWQQRINSGTGWRGMEDRGSPTQNHMDHVHVSLFNQGGLVGSPNMKIPPMFRGGKINYDNTIANLHKGETVLTSPLTHKFEDLAARLNSQGGDNIPIQITFTGPVNSEVDVEAGVTAALRKRDVRIGRDRRVK